MKKNLNPLDRESLSTSLQSLRGLACLFLVSFHVVGDTPLRGLHLEIEHPIKLVNFSLVDLRLPLFAFISGYVFKWEEVTIKTTGKLLKKNFIRLLIPYFAVGTIYCLIRSTVYHDSKSFLMLALYPVDHFWYLQATFLIITVFIIIIICIGSLKIVYSFLVVFFSYAASVFSWKPDLDLFAMWHALGIAPFFFLGHILSRADIISKAGSLYGTKLIRLSSASLLSIIIACRCGIIYLLPPDYFTSIQSNLISLVLGSIAICCLVAMKVNVAFLRYIGLYSYSIFLFHVFFTSSSRIFIDKYVGLNSKPTDYFVGLACGIFLPVLAHKLISKSTVFSLILLGRLKRI